jgi:LPXTG-motif cell wall-anchored protein
MATIEHTHEPTVAKVDTLIDENGNRIDVPDDTALKIATDVEQVTGATGPTNWWWLSLVGIAIVAAILLLLQMLNGNTGTEMIPGTPTAAPQSQTTP